MAAAPLGAGFIGTGRISDLHALEYLRNPRARIVALCDRDADLARKRAARWGVGDAFVTDDMDALLARDDVDVVDILLPHHLHLPAALKAIAAGKAVSLQKPMCRSMAEADRLVAAAAAAPRPFRVFENFIFYPPVRRVRELVDAGAIGTPLSIRIKSTAGRSATAWDVPRGATEWRQDRIRSGGGPLVFDDGHHKFALAWHFLGNPDAVHAFIGATPAGEGVIMDAPSMVSFRFPGGRVGNLEVVYAPELDIVTRHYAQDDRVEITGSRGVVWINCGHGRLGDPPPVALYADGRLTAWRDMATGWEESFILSTRHYIDVLARGDGQAVLSAVEARQILRFALAAEESAQTGRVVELPPPTTD